MVSTLVIDVDSLTRVRELLPDVRLPAGFAPDWDPAADPARLAAARAAAEQRLRSAGLLTADPGGPTDPGSADPGSADPGSADRGARPTVHPSLRAALEAFGRAPIELEVRGWAGDRVVLAQLAVGEQAGVGLTRLQRVTRDGPQITAPADALGLELAVFPAGEVLAAVERLLPPGPAGSGPPAPAGSPAPLEPVRGLSTRTGPVGPVRVDWPTGLALLTLLRRRDSIAADQLPVAREVLRILLGSAGLSAVPPVLDRLAGPLEAAVRITLSAAGGGAHSLWLGYWLQCGGHLIGLRAGPGPDLSAGPPGTAAPPGDPGADVVLTLVPADGRGLRADLLLALSEAFVSSGLAVSER